MEGRKREGKKKEREGSSTAQRRREGIAEGGGIFWCFESDE